MPGLHSDRVDAPRPIPRESLTCYPPLKIAVDFSLKVPGATLRDNGRVCRVSLALLTAGKAVAYFVVPLLVFDWKPLFLIRRCEFSERCIVPFRFADTQCSHYKTR